MGMNYGVSGGGGGGGGSQLWQLTGAAPALIDINSVAGASGIYAKVPTNNDVVFRMADTPVPQVGFAIVDAAAKQAFMEIIELAGAKLAHLAFYDAVSGRNNQTLVQELGVTIAANDGATKLNRRFIDEDGDTHTISNSGTGEGIETVRTPTDEEVSFISGTVKTLPTNRLFYL